MKSLVIYVHGKGGNTDFFCIIRMKNAEMVAKLV